MAVGEAQHIKGQDGVALAKRWLEATGRFDVQWHSLQEAAVPYLAAEQYERPKEGFDILAQHLDAAGETRFDVFVEVKNYESPSDQTAHYRKFLTQCASAVLAWEADPPTKTTQFMWVTWHPFGASEHYLKNVTSETVRQACLSDFPKPGTKKADNVKYRRVPESMVTTELCDEVARRLWFVIAPMRLEEMIKEAA